MPPRTAGLKAPRLAAAARKLLDLAARLSEGPCWLVGGSLRDALLGRDFHDLDIAAPRARALAKALAAATGGVFVAMDEQEQVYRVALPQAPDGVSQIDVAGLQGKAIEEDLARRDFTVNALAMPAAGGPIIDPRGGRADLARRLLRAESEALFRADPLRLLRALRLGAQLDLSIEPATLKMMSRLRARVRHPAGERLHAEIMGLLDAPGCARWLGVMDEAGLLTALFPELEAARPCATAYYGPGGVLKHSLDTARRAEFLLGHLARVFPNEAGTIAAHLAARSGPTGSHRAVLILTALLHDVSKAETAKVVDGRLRFFGHDTRGAERAAQMLSQLRFPRQQIRTVSAVIAQHLRPGHLAAGGPVTEKAAYRFFRDLGEEAASLLLVCWADYASYVDEARLTRLLRRAQGRPGEGLGKVPEDARKTLLHLQVVSLLMRKLFSAAKPAVPLPLLDGREVMKALKLAPGPDVGAALERLREAQAEGAVRTRQEALEFLKKAA